MRIPKQSIIILDFGSQYTQLIARRIRELNVFAQVLSYKTSIKTLQNSDAAGIILSGGPTSVYQPNAPHCDQALFQLDIPILGICYGFQLMVHILGGQVGEKQKREFGLSGLNISKPALLFEQLPTRQRVWMSHKDHIDVLPENFVSLAQTENSPFAAIADIAKKRYGLQFHPEVAHSEYGRDILANFCLKICQCNQTWTMSSFIGKSIAEIQDKVQDKKVILGLSGGIDSSVAAALIHKAIGQQLICVFINNGLLRHGEADYIQKLFTRYFPMHLHYEDSSECFLRKLRGIRDPEEKRKIIGHEFIRIFETIAESYEEVNFLAQGTTYPDVIESTPIAGNPSAVIKSHHNVGCLPEQMKLTLLEPLRSLFKDEVRNVGAELGLPDELVHRHPFPGPGLAVRIIGEVNEQRLDILRDADQIFIDEIQKAGIYQELWQAFAVLLPIHSVGVMGDERSYEHVICLRAVESTDAMTADWARLPYELLGRVANRIVNEVRKINHVCYDISSKPPSTIEWE